MERKQYIKPSVLQLEFRTDVEVVSMAGCKNTLNNNGQTLLPGTGSCQDTACTAPADS